jgi:hypothetical protein
VDRDVPIDGTQMTFARDRSSTASRVSKEAARWLDVALW